MGSTGVFPGKPTSVGKQSKTRRSKRKSSKKYYNLSSDDNKWSIFHNNIRGYNSKKHSFLSIIKGVNPNVITINELAYKKDKKLTIPGYQCYNRNRISENMGGVATAVRIDEKIATIKVDEGIDKDEFIWTRHSQFRTPINIINVYGEIESRYSKKEVEERWERIMEKIARIEATNESIILIGDLNKAVGNGQYGVKDNNNKVSFGGKLIHKLLSTERFTLVNNSSKCFGGPFTRVDPSNPSTLSCLSLVIVSIDLYDFIDNLKIDKDRDITPHRAIGKKQNLVYTDHFALVLSFKNLPTKPHQRTKKEKQTQWNTNKTGGWAQYKEMTEENQELVELCEDEEISSPTIFNDKLEKVVNKVKYKAFGKISFSSHSAADKPLENLYKEKAEYAKNTSEVENILNVEQRISELLLKKQSI